MVFSVGLFYFFESLIFVGVSLRLFEVFQKTRNTVTKSFVLLFLFLALTFLCWSLPSLLFPKNNLLLNIGSLLGEVFIFIGFSFGAAAFVYSKFPRFPQRLVYFAVILSGAAIVSLNASIFGSSELDSQGVIEWHLHPIAVGIYSVMIILLTFSLGIEFFEAAIKNSETRFRSLLLGLASIVAGPGGVLAISNGQWQIILLGHVLLSLGVVLIGWGFFFTEKP